MLAGRADEQVGVAQRRFGGRPVPGAAVEADDGHRRSRHSTSSRHDRRRRLGRPAVDPFLLGNRNDVPCAGE